MNRSRRDMMRREWRNAVGLDKKGQKARMRRLAFSIVAEWGAIARTEGNMTTTENAYLKAIHVRSITANSCTVELPGGKALTRKTPDGRSIAAIARMIEFGLPARDVRSVILKGRAEVNVPFKYTAGMISEMGALGQFGANKTIKEARALAPSIVREGRWSGQMMAANFTRIVNNPHTHARHAVDRLAGLRRMASKRDPGKSGKSAKEGRTSRYITFRVAKLSGLRNTNDKRWWHPGVKARHLTEKVQKTIPDLWKRLA